MQEQNTDGQTTNRELTIHGTLDEQLARCNREIERCESYLNNPQNPDRAGAELGLIDWLVNRQDVLAEMDGEHNLKKNSASAVHLNAKADKLHYIFDD